MPREERKYWPFYPEDEWDVLEAWDVAGLKKTGPRRGLRRSKLAGGPSG